MRIVMGIRPMRWFFLKHWYSVRWAQEFNGKRYYLLDIGAITIGVAK